jgi:hypothetical protein
MVDIVTRDELGPWAVIDQSLSIHATHFLSPSIHTTLLNSALMMEAVRSSEMSATQPTSTPNIQKQDQLQR